MAISMKFISLDLGARLARRSVPGNRRTPGSAEAPLRSRSYRARFRWALGVNLVLIGGLLVLPTPGRAGSPERFVEDFNLRLSSEFGRPDLGAAERRIRFARLLDSAVDLSAAGALMLGSRWTEASSEDRARFCAAFRAYLIGNIAARFHGTGEREIRVTAIEDDGTMMTVVTQLSGPFGEAASVEWRLVPDGSDDWRLANLTIAGMSMAAIMRSQFNAVLNQGGPGLDPVIALLLDRQGEATP